MLATFLQYGRSDVSLCSVPSATSLHSASSDMGPLTVLTVTSSGATLGLFFGSRPHHTSKAFRRQFWGSPDKKKSGTEGTGKDQETQAGTQEKGLSRHQVSAVSAVRRAGRLTALLLM